MRAILFVLLSATAAPADPVADLAKTAAASGSIYLDFKGPQRDGSCAAEAYALEKVGEEWHFLAENSSGVFRLRPWSEQGGLHLTHNPRAGGFTVMSPLPAAIPGVAIFRPAQVCPEGATQSTDCTSVPERLKGLTHMVSLMPVCSGGGS